METLNAESALASERSHRGYYQKTFTRAVNVWAKDDTYGLGQDGLEWLKSTGRQFADEIAVDPKWRHCVANTTSISATPTDAGRAIGG